MNITTTNSSRFRIGVLTISMLAWFFLDQPASVLAQGRSSPTRLAVDVLIVRQLGRLHGVILSQDDKKVSIAVRKAWLEQQHPEFAQQHLASESETIAKSQKAILRRLEQWKQERTGEDAAVLRQFIDENIKTLGLDQPVNDSAYAFSVVEIDRTKVRRIYAQKEERRLVSAIAWQEKFDDVERRSFIDLKRELEKKKIQVEGYDLELGDQMPLTVESDAKWVTRKAIVEFYLLPRLEYHGVGTVFYRRDGNVNAIGIMQQMMQGGSFSQIDEIGKELGLPEFQDRRNDFDDSAWIERMIKTAEKEERRCFSVSSLSQGDTVTVDLTLYFKASDEKWYPLKRIAAIEKLADQKRTDLDEVKEDPQVAKVLSAVRQLGFDNQQMIDKAIRNGAATKNALSATASELEKFLKPYGENVSYPPIPFGNGN